MLQEKHGIVLCLACSAYHESGKLNSQVEQFIDKTQSYFHFSVLGYYVRIRCFSSTFDRYESCEPLLSLGLRPVQVRWRQKAEMSKV